MNNNTKCLWCNSKLKGQQQKYCSNKCGHYYCYYYYTKPRRKRIKKKTISQTHKLLIKEWNYEKNNKLGLDPDNITFGSHKKPWWICLKNHNHKWKTSVKHRTNGSNCPYCSGQKTDIYNCLETVHPVLSQEWHSTKNGKLTPKDVTLNSGRKIWWQCKKNKNHIWIAPINNRTSHKSGCPYCSGLKACKENCLNTLNPRLSKQWHPVKNGECTPYNMTVGSSKKSWWICEKEHEWEADIGSRNKGNGCPYCSGKKADIHNCLATNYPNLIKEWHSTKNGKLTPYNVTPGSVRKIWWICKNKHEWTASICNRKNGTTCLICSIKNRSGYNHPNYNPNLTDEDRISRRNDKKIPVWRKEVYTRDNYTCQICGDNSGGNLHAHHLMGYNKYPKQRFDKDNGTTLCIICHMDFHNIYGRGNNTLQQFKEYEASCLLSSV